MCVKVLLADDAEVVRNAIRSLFSGCEDISFVGEAATFSETVQKAQELLPDVVIFDLHMAEGNSLHLPAGMRLLAISIANDDEAKAIAESIGAAKFLDKMSLAQELIPAILELAPMPAANPCGIERMVQTQSDKLESGKVVEAHLSAGE